MHPTTGSQHGRYLEVDSSGIIDAPDSNKLIHMFVVSRRLSVIGRIHSDLCCERVHAPRGSKARRVGALSKAFWASGPRDAQSWYLMQLRGRWVP